MESKKFEAVSAFVGCVRDFSIECISRENGLANNFAQAEDLLSGKMLRSRLAGHLIAPADKSPSETVRNLCAAVEIVHAASICHDDLVDGAAKRRGRRSLWLETGSSGAVLIGDLLFCRAMELACRTDGGKYVCAFLEKVSEVVNAESEQELVLRGRQLDEPTCLRLARGKTGPLFAFPAMVCAADDLQMQRSLEQAGYFMGTAYQLADDLLDVLGDETACGKTLQNDAGRGKFTLAQMPNGEQITLKKIEQLCRAARESLEDYPDFSEGLQNFIQHDFMPVLEKGLNSRQEVFR